MSKPRTRIFADTIQSFASQRTDTLTGSPPATYAWSYDYYALFDRLDDVQDPDYKKRIENGEIIINPFSRRTTSLSSISGSHYCEYTSGGSTYNATWSGYYMLRLLAYAGFDPTYVDDIYLADELQYWLNENKRVVAADMEKARYAFGEDVAEIRKTLGSLVGMFNSIRNILLRIPALTQTYVRNGYTLQKALAKVWLKLRYELRPLLISSENLLQISITGLNNAIGKRQSLKRWQPIRDKTDDTLCVIGNVNDGQFTISRTRTIDYGTCFGAIFENRDPLKSDLEALGLGFKDMVPTLWAITRFSFLVDKFINISNLIRGTQNILDPDIHVLGAWSNISKDYTCEYTADYVRGNGFTYSTAPYTTTFHSVDKTRYLDSLTLVDVLNLDFTVPDYDTFIDIFAIFVSPKIRGTNFRV